MFEKYLELGSIAKTARWANAEGNRTKHQKFSTGREVLPREFQRADIQRLLKNVTYMGKVRFDDTDFPGLQDAIIDPKTFIEVQKLLDARKEKPRRGDQKQQDLLLLGLLKCGYCGGALTSSFANKKMKSGETKRYYYYKCTKKNKGDACDCEAADLKAEAIESSVIEAFRDLAREPKKLDAVVKAATKTAKDGMPALERERDKLNKKLSQAEQQSRVLVERLADPDLKDLSAIKDRLRGLDQEEKELKNRIAELTLEIRGRRTQTISAKEVKAAFAEFDKLWGQLEFTEKMQALRLLVKEIRVKFKKGAKEGEMLLEAWGRHDKPLKKRFRNLSEKKLRNQDVWYPLMDSNHRHPD
ncbi:MAG: recombinase zinc beta ribbon domain-containing protein [Planctomycetota bacterium]